MRDIIVYVLIALVYKVESRTLCSDQRCVCSNKENTITCSSHPDVLNANYSLPISVRVLDLCRNNLTRVGRSPSLASETLRVLLLVNNRIKEISVDAFNLPSLETLDLSHNELAVIRRDTFATLKNLMNLNLANNKFSLIGSLNFYHLKNLRSIVLDNNDIGPSLGNHSLFEGGYELTKDIQRLSMNNIKLSCNNKKHIFMNGPVNLKNLSLAHNNITEILDLNPSLRFLDLSNNPIEVIPSNVFYHSQYLIELKLNSVLIEEIQDTAFYFLKHVRNLELESNARLKKFSPLAWGGNVLNNVGSLSLVSISLRGASLTSLDPQMEGIFKKINTVDLRDNPWNCDCDLSWFQNIHITDEFVDLRCSTPQHLANRSVLELSSAEFVCEKTSSQPGDYVRTSINVVVYCALLIITVLMMYFFIFSPKPFMYRELPVEFPRTP